MIQTDILTFDAKVSSNTDVSYTHSVHLIREEVLDLYWITWHLSYWWMEVGSSGAGMDWFIICLCQSFWAWKVSLWSPGILHLQVKRQYFELTLLIITNILVMNYSGIQLVFNLYTHQVIKFSLFTVDV